MARRKNLQHRVDARRKIAEEKTQERELRSPAQQLKMLDDRLGVKAGAVCERKRLQDLIEEVHSKKKKKSRGKKRHNDKKKLNRQKK